MAKEYIEREAIIAKCVKMTACEWNRRVAPASWVDAYEEFVGDVLEIPAADVVEVVHGRWEDVYGGKYQNKRYRCTVCKEKALFKFYQDELITWHEEQKLSNYCPNCGARMDGE